MILSVRVSLMRRECLAMAVSTRVPTISHIYFEAIFPCTALSNIPTDGRVIEV